jgi:hypothetical protein
MHNFNNQLIHHKVFSNLFSFFSGEYKSVPLWNSKTEVNASKQASQNVLLFVTSYPNANHSRE